jgi:glycosyltransferase involved in cell wall biosynthesis
MKIALIGQKGLPATWGGVEQHAEKLALELSSRGNTVVAYNRPYYANERAVEQFSRANKGIEVVTLKTIKSKHLDTIVHTFRATIDAMKRNVDVYHYQGVGPALLSWMPRLMRPSARVVATFHSPDRLHQKWGRVARFMLTLGEWASLTFAHKTIAVSKTLKAYAKEEYGKDAVYVPNGVLIPEVKKVDEITEFGLHTDEYILMVSRLIPHKGAHTLIEAFTQTHTTKKLVIVGDSSYTDAYVKELKELAAGDDRIVFTGYQTGEVLEQLFSNAYLYVQPSESEGLSIAVLEAASYGKAVLASNIPANAEIVRGRGFLFENKSVDDLLEQLTMLLVTPKRVAQAGEQLHAMVKQQYNWETITDETENVYRSTFSTVETLHDQAVKRLSTK